VGEAALVSCALYFASNGTQRVLMENDQSGEPIANAREKED